jgi:hypothetical protein
MVEYEGYPKRRRAGPAKSAADFETAMPKGKRTPDGQPAPHTAIDVARYIADMTVQLEGMAIAARLDLLAYFLGMAKAESELFVRTNAAAEDPSVLFNAGESSQEPFRTED